eukprot:s3673_g3.t1
MDVTVPDELTGQVSNPPLRVPGCQADVEFELDKLFSDAMDGSASAGVLGGGQEYKGFRGKWARKRLLSHPDEPDDDPVPSPSLAPSVDAQMSQLADLHEGQTVEPPACTSQDNAASVTHSFLIGIKMPNIVLPWEQPWLAPIFGDPLAAPSLSMPAGWDPSFVDPTKDVIPGNAPAVEQIPVFSLARCIKHRVDRSLLEERESQTGKAVAKMRCFLEVAYASEAGKQLALEHDETGQQTLLLSIIGTRSPGTIIKRMNALLHFYRWFTVTFEGQCLPLQKAHVWEYIRHLQTSGAAPTKAMSFVQALRFAHHVLQVHGAEQCVQSRRLQGSAELQMALKRPTRQARPLSVEEVRRLHRATLNVATDIQQRVLASHLLLMLYTRSRVSDLAHVEEVAHDVSMKESANGVPAFIQITTRYHKAARTAEKKRLLLLIVASSTAVMEDDWLATWLRLRRKAGLKVAGQFNSALQPAPDVNKAGEWMVRPLSCSEVTMILRGLLQCEDRDLTSHSLKATCLSWAAKGETPREQRRLLGRHASSIQDSDSVYARDLAFAPVQALQRVLVMIREGQFEPDQNRSNYFKDSNPLVPGTPAPRFQPGTPAFLSKEAVAEPVRAFPGDEGFELAEVKLELEQSLPEPAEAEEEIDWVSSSESLTSSSKCEDVDSDAELGDEVSDTEQQPSVQSFLHDAFVKNKKSGIIHRIPDIGLEVTGSTYANSELMQGKTTKCGRLTASGYSIVENIVDWTAKCRICFKGCRAP